MKRTNKALYEQIMRNVSREVKKTLNESFDDDEFYDDDNEFYDDDDEMVPCCPECGYEFDESEAYYNDNTGHLDYECPKCGWYGDDSETDYIINK